MTTLPITVITTHVPHRSHLLADAVASVQGQDRRPEAHLIGVDCGHGPNETKNRLVVGANTPWVAFLDDDDVLYPDHLAKLFAESAGADVVYSFCDVEGRPGWSPNRLFDPVALQWGNFIPITTLIRRSTFLERGGFAPGVQHLDWDLWLRIVDQGGVIRCVPEVTWLYRFQPDSYSLIPGGGG